MITMITMEIYDKYSECYIEVEGESWRFHCSLTNHDCFFFVHYGYNIFVTAFALHVEKGNKEEACIIYIHFFHKTTA